MPEFGELRSVDLREIWPNGSADFTPWAEQNIAALSNFGDSIACMPLPMDAPALLE
jgi:hypothetical protein